MPRYRIHEFAELDSTNLHALANIQELSDGDVIHAHVQTKGHGRLNRRWISHVPGNLCLSLVLKPGHGAPADLPLAGLSQLLALSVCRALDACGTQANLKWPNDVMVEGGKIAGLLAETVTCGGFTGLVLGLGVNLNLDLETIASIDQPATSLSACTGMPVDVIGFRDGILKDFFSRYDEFLAAGFPLIRSEYLGRCRFIGTHVGVLRGGEAIHGLAHTISAGGALEITTQDGLLRTVELGEMFELSNH